MNAGYQAVYFGASSSNNNIRGIVGGGISYLPAYAAIWMRYAPPPSPPVFLVLHASYDAFNQTEFQLAIAEITGIRWQPH